MMYDQHYNMHNLSQTYHHDSRSLYSSSGSRSPGSGSRSHHDSRSLYSGSGSGSFDKENDYAQSRALRLMENVVVGTNGAEVCNKTTIPKLSTFASTQVTTKTNHAIPLSSRSTPPFSNKKVSANTNAYTTRVSSHDQDYITMYTPTNYNLKSKNYRKLEQMTQSTRQDKKKARRTTSTVAVDYSMQDSWEEYVPKCEIDLERERSAENRALRALLLMPTRTSVALV